ncbi:MAG: recombinase family protein [Luteimonas sp.]
MIYGYARASTFGPPLAAQLNAFAFCDVVRQEAAPGETAVLDIVVEGLQAGDVLAVTRLDRIGRSVVGLIGFVRALQERGVGLKVLDAGIDTTTTQGGLFLDAVTVFADLERDLVQEQANSEIQAASVGGGQNWKAAGIDGRQVECNSTAAGRRHVAHKRGSPFGR